jgi:hypothetical protein
LVKLAFALAHHDHAYVDRRGGIDLLVYLRGYPARVQYRRQAIDRALRAFDTAARDCVCDPEVGGLGLLVLQRALLAAEDLGRLLHALDGPESWDRLRAGRIPDISAAYERARRDPAIVIGECFRLATLEQLDAEDLREEQRLAGRELRARVFARWSHMLSTAATLWFTGSGVAKATMHAFPILAGEHVFKRPGAGVLGAGLRNPGGGRVGCLIASTLRGHEVTTQRQLVRLDRDAVLGYHRHGRLAARLAGELCDAQASSIMGGFAALLPLGLVTLSESSRLALDGPPREAQS